MMIDSARASVVTESRPKTEEFSTCCSLSGPADWAGWPQGLGGWPARNYCTGTPVGVVPIDV